MTYLWINPVSERMVSEQNLKRILTEHQLTQVRCQEDWGGIVLKQYAELMEHADGTVADARCPEAVNLIERYNEERNLSIQVADIEPILIHCARELSARADLADGEKIITTPCRILAEQGNALELPHTRFVSWKDFFSELGESLESLSGREDIEDYLEERSRTSEGESEDRMMSGTAGSQNIGAVIADAGRKPLLLELLYCPKGCHMGDGVR